MTTLVFQPVYNGYHAQIRSTALRALEEIALNVLSYNQPSSIGDLQEEVAEMTRGYAELFGSIGAPNLAHMLALEVMIDEAESLNVDVHDLDTKAGHDSLILSYDLLMPQDPSFWVLRSVYEVLDDRLSIEAARDTIPERLSSIVLSGTDADIERMKNLAAIFGYPADDRRNLLSQPFEEGRNPFTQIEERALAMFDAFISELRPGAPTP